MRTGTRNYFGTLGTLFCDFPLAIRANYYAALLPRRGPHNASHSVCPSVCPSVPLLFTERHVAPPSELQ